jgi:lactate permease
MAIVPYVVLTDRCGRRARDLAVGDALEALEIGLPFPEVDHGLRRRERRCRAVQPVHAIHASRGVLARRCTRRMAPVPVAWLLRRWNERNETEPIGSALVGDAVPASVAIVSFLVLSNVMDHSGQTETLALGIAEVAPPAVFVFVSGFIGVLGAFMTSSNTASNVLFGPLQQTVATAEGISEATIIAAQSNGGALGNAIAPANVVLGTSTAGSSGRRAGAAANAALDRGGGDAGAASCAVGLT